MTRCSAGAGRKVYGAGWQYDGRSPSQDKLSFGTCFVTCGIVVRLPFCTRPVCLPVLARLVLPGKKPRAKKGKKAAPAPGTKVSAAAGLVTLLAAAFPGRAIDVVADAAYHGPALKHLPPAVTWTCRLRANAVLYDLAPPRPPGTRGRPRRKGDRLGTPGQLAAAAAWTPATVRIYGRDQDMHLAGITCLWYGCLDTRTVRVILARSDAGLLALVTTDLAASAAALIDPLRRPLVHRAGLRRRPQRPGRRRGPQPHPPRRRAHRPVRPAHPHPGHHLVRPARPQPGPHHRPPPRPALVPRQDRTRLRGHAHPAPPRPDHRPHFQGFRAPPHTRANQSRPGSLARSSRITAKHQAPVDPSNRAISKRRSHLRQQRPAWPWGRYSGHPADLLTDASVPPSRRSA